MQNEIPEFLYNMLLKQYGEEITGNIIKGYFAKRPVTLRVNTLKSNISNIEKQLKLENIQYKKVEWNENALILENVREIEIQKLAIYQNGEIYLQSLSSMLPAIILEPREKENILDMAAAPGGKTTQIAAITNNKSMITACEKNKIRLERLKYNLEKQGVKCVNVMQEDARKLSDYFSFDKILLDSPCSGSGTDNINQDSFSKELIDRLVKVQYDLLTKAIKILKHGGEMVYSTCSILMQENEEVLEKVLSKNNVEIIPIQIDKNIPTLPVKIKGTICVHPTNEFEGFYIAKIKKV